MRDWGTGYLAEHPEHTRQSVIHYQNLLYHNPEALMRGEGRETVELIYEQHALQGTEPDWLPMGEAGIGFAQGHTLT